MYLQLLFRNLCKFTLAYVCIIIMSRRKFRLIISLCFVVYLCFFI